MSWFVEDKRTERGMQNEMCSKILKIFDEVFKKKKSKRMEWQQKLTWTDEENHKETK